MTYERQTINSGNESFQHNPKKTKDEMKLPVEEKEKEEAKTRKKRRMTNRKSVFPLLIILF